MFRKISSTIALFLLFTVFLKIDHDILGGNKNNGDLYGVVFYGKVTPDIVNLIIDRKYDFVIGFDSPKLRSNGIKTFAYLDILGLPIEMLSYAQERHPEWLLRTKSGKILTYWYGKNFVCNIGEKGFIEYLVNKSKEIERNGYSGVFLDDVSFDLPNWLTSPEDPINYNESIYGRWKDNVLKLMSNIKSNTSLEVIYNAGWTSPDPEAMKIVDGVMLESFPGSWEGDVNNPKYYYREWNEVYRIATIAMNFTHNKKVIALSYGNNLDSAIFSFCVARVFGFYYWFSIPALNIIPNSPVLSLSLGSPISSYYNVSGTFYRLYENGIVLFNPSNARSKVRISNLKWEKLYDLKSGKVLVVENGEIELTVEPVSGIVLTTYKVEKPSSFLSSFSTLISFIFASLMLLLFLALLLKK